MSPSEYKTFAALDSALHISLKKSLSQNTYGSMKSVKNYCTIKNSTYRQRISSYLKSSFRESEFKFEDEGRGLLSNSYDQSLYQGEENLGYSKDEPTFIAKAGRILLDSLKAHAELYNPALALDPQLPPSAVMITSASYTSSEWNC